MYIMGPISALKATAGLIIIVSAAIFATRDLIRDTRAKWRLRRHRKPKIVGKCTRCGGDLRTLMGKCEKCGESVNRIPPVPKKLL